MRQASLQKRWYFACLLQKVEEDDFGAYWQDSHPHRRTPDCRGRKRNDSEEMKRFCSLAPSRQSALL